MQSYLRMGVLVGMTAVTCWGSTACVSKDGLVGEIDGEVGGAGAPAKLSSDTTTRFWVEQFTVPPPEEGRCLAIPLPVSDEQVSCRAYGLELKTDECCNSAWRIPATPSVVSTVVNDALRLYQGCDVPGQPACADYCVCEIPLAMGAEHEACLDPYTGEGDGWCYVAPAQGFGSADAVRACPSDAQQLVNVAGAARLGVGENGYLLCADSRVTPQPSPLGSVCVPDDENRPDFPGFRREEVTVSEQTSCESGLCLVAHFQGRVSCPYGQPEGGTGCFLPGSDAKVMAEVQPQIVLRSPAQASVCSCRCAGPGDGPFCDCAAGQECVELIAELGLPDNDRFAGSYCVERGAVDEWQFTSTSNPCEPGITDCGPARPY